MANPTNKEDPRTFLYLGKELKAELVDFAVSDARFESVSACARHLIQRGMDADKKDREEPLKAVN